MLDRRRTGRVRGALAWVACLLCLAVTGCPCRAVADAVLGALHEVGGQAAPLLRSPSVSWRRTAGPLALAGGGALLAGGFAVSIVSRGLMEDLRSKAGQGPLGPADQASFGRLDRLNRASTGLCIAGAAAATVGAWLWLTAPDLRTDFQPVRGGFVFQYRGRF